MMALEQLVLRSIRRHQLFKTGEPVSVAVSGGKDSLALLYALHSTLNLHGAELMVLSIDHGLRKASRDDVKWVGQIAASLNIPFQGISVNLDPGPNLQERARIVRLEALRMASSGKVALGHHQQDQAETVLYRLLRGSGANGLSGMSYQRGVFVRPMLDASIEDIEKYLSSKGIQWREDPTNVSSIRGQIRQLLPKLDALHGGAVRSLAQSASLLSTDDAFLDSLCHARFSELYVQGGLDLKAFLNEGSALQQRLLRHLCVITKAPVRYERIVSFIAGLSKGTKRVQLPKGFAFDVQSGVIRVIELDY